MSFKDIWFAQMERELNANMDKGMTFDKAYLKASTEAWDKAREALADKADVLRKKEKGE